MTFSIAARCAVSGRFALAVASSSPAVAARCAYVRAGVGAVASQNVTDPRLGRQALDLMALGASAEEVVRIVRDTAPDAAWRQVTAIDAMGRTAVFSGRHALGVNAVAHGKDCVSAGNLLAGEGVPRTIVAAFEASAGGDLGDRMIAAMQAGLAAGGEAGPIRSAGLLMADAVPWPVADLRVDWHDDPIGELAALWELWKPQMAAYVGRALAPGEAPSFGVPGDL